MEDREFGRLEGKVTALEKRLDTVAEALDRLDSKIDDLLKIKNAGWGVLIFLGVAWHVLESAFAHLKAFFTVPPPH